MIILNAGMPFSGHLWVGRIISRIGALKQMKYAFVFSNGDQLVDDINAATEASADKIIITSEWSPDLEQTVAPLWDSVFTVATIRDPRDVTMSLMRCENLELGAALERARLGAQNFFRIYNSVDANVIVYEQLIKNPGKIIFALASTLEMQIPQARADRLSRITSKTHNNSYGKADSEIPDVVVSFDNEADITGINGSWRKFFDESDQRRVDHELSGVIDNLPYKRAFE